MCFLCEFFAALFSAPFVNDIFELMKVKPDPRSTLAREGKRSSEDRFLTSQQQEKQEDRQQKKRVDMPVGMQGDKKEVVPEVKVENYEEEEDNDTKEDMQEQKEEEHQGYKKENLHEAKEADFDELEEDEHQDVKEDMQEGDKEDKQEGKQEEDKREEPEQKVDKKKEQDQDEDEPAAYVTELEGLVAPVVAERVTFNFPASEENFIIVPKTLADCQLLIAHRANHAPTLLIREAR